jgi:hypothetical protein
MVASVKFSLVCKNARPNELVNFVGERPDSSIPRSLEEMIRLNMRDITEQLFVPALSYDFAKGNSNHCTTARNSHLKMNDSESQFCGN